MARQSIFFIHICAAVVIFNSGILAQNFESPCPRLFVYEGPENYTDRWYGIVTLLSESELTGIWLRLLFDQPSYQLGNWFGQVKTTDNKDYLVANREHKLMPHTPLLVRFYVRYDPSKPVPRLVGFRLNAKTVCPENQANTEAPTTEPHLYVSGEKHRGGSSHYGGDRSGHTDSNENCGKPINLKASPLVLFGQTSVAGEWPWHVALYKNEGGTLSYVCGGSLLSHRWMVTAAHCVTDLSTGEALSRSSFLVHLGTASLKHFSAGTQTVQLSNIQVHPHFSLPYYHNDIALLKAAKWIDFTDYVKPICLWQGDNTLQNVVGTLGTIVGWGLDETNHFSDVLKRTQMPIVDTAPCIYSKPQFFSKFTSLTTYCAGFRNGSSACNGDSGSGMVIERDDGKGGTSWYLRGLVSISIPITGKSSCDPYEYIVFTDASKYVNWIKKYITEGE